MPTRAEAVRGMGGTELNRPFTDAQVAEPMAFLAARSGPLPAVAAPTLPQ